MKVVLAIENRNLQREIPMDPANHPSTDGACSTSPNSLKTLGVSHVFFMDAILRPTLVRMEEHADPPHPWPIPRNLRPIWPITCPRQQPRPGVCMAQSVGAANLAAGLQDAYLHRAPLVAMTGRKEPMLRYRNAYPGGAAYAALRLDHQVLDGRGRGARAAASSAQAFRAATDGSPRRCIWT
ncbi:MAG: hypothetical protein R3D85_02685 [Paracoccaceae bacterium]